MAEKFERAAQIDELQLSPGQKNRFTDQILLFYFFSPPFIVVRMVREIDGRTMVN